MLKITNISVNENTIRLRLDGALSGPWVEELRTLCEAKLAEEATLALDCAGLSFVDARGVALMRRLSSQQVPLMNCSPLVSLQLRESAAL